MRRSVDDDPYETAETPGSSRSELTEMVDMLGRRLGGAILVAGALIGIGLYTGGGDEHDGPKYQAFAADGMVFRTNTESGTIIACKGTQCGIVLQRGQDLAEDEGAEALFKSPAAPAPQLPAPAQQQALPAPAQAAPAPVQVAPAPTTAPTPK